MKLTDMFNICDTCVYAPCLCGNEPENCVAYVAQKRREIKCLNTLSEELQ